MTGNYRFHSRAPKYRAVPTVVDGTRFASKAEARRYSELILLQKSGAISGLKLQPAFDLSVAGHRICRYVADFEYVEQGRRVVEDYKGVQTPTFRIKCKLMKALLGIEIRITGRHS